MQDKRRRTGRPPRTPDPGERVPMSFRVTPEFKERLDRAAEQSGRSLSQEIELRLTESFRDEAHLGQIEQMLGGPEVFGILMIIGRAMAEAGRAAGFAAEGEAGSRVWLTNPYAFDQAVQSVNSVLQALRPHLKAEPPDDSYESQLLGEVHGVRLADAVLGESESRTYSVTIGDEPGPEWVEEVRSKLGDVLPKARGAKKRGGDKS